MFFSQCEKKLLVIRARCVVRAPHVGATIGRPIAYVCILRCRRCTVTIADYTSMPIGRAMRAPTVMRGTQPCRGDHRSSDLPWSAIRGVDVRRRAGVHLPPCLELQKETVTQQSLYLVLTAVVNISSVAAGDKFSPAGSVTLEGKR